MSGDVVEVLSVPDSLLTHAARFGFSPGSVVRVGLVLPGGTIAFGVGRQEMAMGCGHASSVTVSPLGRK